MSSIPAFPLPVASGTPTSAASPQRSAAVDCPPVPAAAVLDDGSVDIDALLAAVARAQRQAGRRVRGLLMTHPDGPGCNGAMVLVDIETRDEYLVSQRLGRGSTSCRADPHGFARASRVLRDALEQSPDLVISNRFGSLEAEGGGFAAELLALMANGVPVLTAVATPYLGSWERFSGGAAVLPAQAAAVSLWLAQVLPPRAAAPARARCGMPAG